MCRRCLVVRPRPLHGHCAFAVRCVCFACVHLPVHWTPTSSPTTHGRHIGSYSLHWCAEFTHAVSSRMHPYVMHLIGRSLGRSWRPSSDASWTAPRSGATCSSCAIIRTTCACHHRNARPQPHKHKHTRYTHTHTHFAHQVETCIRDLVHCAACGSHMLSHVLFKSASSLTNTFSCVLVILHIAFATIHALPVLSFWTSCAP